MTQKSETSANFRQLKIDREDMLALTRRMTVKRSSITRIAGDYEPGEPECGFLFPTYAEGGALVNCIDIYQADEKRPHEELTGLLLGAADVRRDR